MNKFKTQPTPSKPKWKRIGFLYWTKRIGDNYIHIKQAGYKQYKYWYVNHGIVYHGIRPTKTVDHAKKLADKHYPEFLEKVTAQTHV